MVDYTEINVEHHRQHLKQRISALEDTHYRHSVSIKLYDMSKVSKDDQNYKNDVNTVAECEKVHAHLLELLAELPESKEADATTEGTLEV